MPRSSSGYALLCAALFLVIWPLTVQKPGLPYSLKADEPAYLLAARSLWEDHDLRCEEKDLLRVYDDFFLSPQNLILMSPDGWQTTFYAKPYFGSLVAAPLVALFGANGYIALNMLYLVLCVWLGWIHLARRNPPGLALLVSGAFFFLSAAFQYVFWIQPEVQSLLSVTAALFFAFYEPPTGEGRSSPGRLSAFLMRHRLLLAGLAIGPAVNAKPPYGLLLLPAFLACFGKRFWRNVLALGIGAAISVGGIAAGQKALTGTWSPYLGMLRRGFNIHNPYQMPLEAPRAEYKAQLQQLQEQQGQRKSLLTDQEGWDRQGVVGVDWSWILGPPNTNKDRVRTDLMTFFVGRHTGVVPWYPFFAIAFLWFLLGGGWRDGRRWAALLSWLVIGIFFVLWHPDNYHGGGGFVGNRYIAGIYGAGLFLIDRVRPRLLLAVGTLLAGLFLGQVVFAPLGPPVDQPTLQAYARSRPFDLLPREIALDARVPGYRAQVQADAYLSGRRDRVSVDAGWLSILGPGDVELDFYGQPDLERVALLIRNYAPGNTVRVRMGRDHQVVTFPDGPPPPEGFSHVVVLDPGPAALRIRYYPFSQLQHHWTLHIAPEHGASPGWWGYGDPRVIGARVLYLGPAAHLEKNVYAAEWQSAVAPGQVEAGTGFAVAARLVNRSGEAWPHASLVQVNLAYRWLDESGTERPSQVLRTPLPRDVGPGEAVDVQIAVTAPPEPGTYRLVLEPVYEFVRWFGEVDPAARRELTVQVVERAPAPAPSPG